MTSVSRALADFAAGQSFDDLPAATVEDTRRAILDWLGSALAGSLEPPARMAQEVVATLGKSDEATVFASNASSAAGAALANGVASHILELDDVHKGSTMHAAAPVIPSALAVAQREHASGRAFMLAVAVGYDVALRIGEAVNPSHYRFWHPTGTAATFGAAAAAGTLIGLNADQMLDALGSAGTQAAGLWEFNADGTMSKHLHPGKAAFNGVLAADLAKVGFTGASKILEGDRGFFRAMSTSFDESRITDRLGHLWKIGENCYKVWSCCGHTHTAIDMAMHVRDQVSPGEIASIAIETYGPGYEIVKEMNPRAPYQAKFSIAFVVASAITRGAITLESFAPENFSDDGPTQHDIAELLRKTRVTVAPDLTNKYPAAWPTRIAITLNDGRVIRAASDFPVGNPENPVSTDQLTEKFSTLVAPRWGNATTASALEIIRRLESIDDLSETFSNLATAPAFA